MTKVKICTAHVVSIGFFCQSSVFIRTQMSTESKSKRQLLPFDVIYSNPKMVIATGSVNFYVESTYSIWVREAVIRFMTGLTKTSTVGVKKKIADVLFIITTSHVTLCAKSMLRAVNTF